MLKKILVANRGEIACRIVQTCQRMGIRTVAVYSEADAAALYVDRADEAYPIGPSEPSRSYLNIPVLIDTALKAGVDAIHPGYGFLSENVRFAHAVEAAGLTFIGPKSRVIRQMGDKLEAKNLARQAGVPVIPGSEHPVTRREEVITLANQLGYPLLLKAAGGGGGKGMRIVEAESQIDDFLQCSAHEAQSSFGDGRVFVEKCIEAPRHIEIQILGDNHGNLVHLGERDCSLQRRHQKIIEESPSPFMTAPLRESMGRQALALARQVGYTSAGTVEFMVAPNRDFYFLEMNTRLQVEHPITEMVTGLDLVEQMIRIADGEELSFTQNDITFSGHAIEARIYAEDPAQDFMPSSGRITRFEPPPLNTELRLDTGVDAGAEVSIYYDPMIAKLVAWAPQRPEAIHKLKDALGQFILEGPTHNIGFLEQLLHHQNIVDGNYTTDFIAQEMPIDLSFEMKNLRKAIVTEIYHRNNQHDQGPIWIIVEDGQGTPVRLEDGRAVVGEKLISFQLDWRPRERRFQVHHQNETYQGQVQISDTNVILQFLGVEASFQVMRPRVWELFSHVRPAISQPDNLIIKAPMPGILISVPISVGDRVKQGQPLLVIEAMKMENVLKSPAEAVVKDILAQEGDTLVRNQVLVKLG